MPTHILGINAFHGDSSAAILADGQLVAAVEEERFNRVKHWAGFPVESIRFCLAEAGIRAADLDHVAVSFDPSKNLGRKILFTLFNRPSIKSLIDRAKRMGKSTGIRTSLAEACGCEEGDIGAEIHNVEHHAAHIASAFHLSPFEESAILSVDGMGDFVSTVLAEGAGTQTERFAQVYYPHSLGFLYNVLTMFLGFPKYGDEYKVMGLACYGKPRFLQEFRQIAYPQGDTFELNLDYFTHHEKGVSMSWEGGEPVIQPYHSQKMEELFGPPHPPRTELTEREEDIACSLQAVSEELIFHLLNRLHEKCPSDNLCLAGGVAMNSVANGKITEHTPFKNLYVPAGAADNGTSFGAAYHVWHNVLNNARQFHLDHAYLGTQYKEPDYAAAIEANGLVPQRFEQDELLDKTVDALCDGKVVGWFQGRMEFGARALGNRSLLADPRRRDMRDIINLKIKFREKFRPFAPSILEEHVGEYFETGSDTPFMEKVLPIRAEKHAEIPAVTHFDGTGRLQTVSRKTNPLYWELIRRFADRTGVPILLNTSLNENEPIVNTPDEALKCMLRTQMDAIVLGPFYVERDADGQDPTGSA